MTRKEFIIKLKIKALEDQKSYWKQSYDDSEDFWVLYRPNIDWKEDMMTVHDLNVIIVYSESFYDEPKEIKLSFEEFIENYSNSVNLF